MRQQTKTPRYVALGDLATDCYYENGMLLKVDGGASRFNVICNLAARGNQTCVIAACGNDLLGDIALESLNTLKVDTQFVKQIGNQTRSYHLIVEKEQHTSHKICPFCGKYTWYDKPLADTSFCLSHLKDDDILIFDGLREETLPFLRQTKQEKVIDIGRVKKLRLLTNEELLMYLQDSHLAIVQLNETVEQYLLLRFHLKSKQELYQLIHTNLLIITRGKNGADFITKQQILTKSLYHCQEELDDTGAGDAFFSVVIQNYYDHHKQIDEQWVEDTFLLANRLTSKVVASLGARGHLWLGYVPKNVYNCICEK